MKFIYLSALLAVTPAPVWAVDVSPPSWWANMQDQSLQLMLHEPGISKARISTSDKNIKIVGIQPADSPNYLFVNLDLTQVQPGTITFTARWPDGKTIDIPYTINNRATGSAQREGFSSKDAIYLLTPDRFANGDPANDNVDGYADNADRDNKGGRHGGDIQGIIDHLDYIADMGFTQIWSMPLLENAMDSYSYHGYSTTDYYRIDPRYGSNTLYQTLSEKADEKGIGLIMDMVLNHIGSGHPWTQDPPTADWIHNNGEFTPTSHRRESLHDPHAAVSDIRSFADGWFVPTMPDLNQQNPLLATYLIQNAIWWVEYAHLSGIRVDTYSYSDKTFLSEWTRRLMQEYPALNIVGEEWSVNPIITSYWQAGSVRRDDYESALPSVMDFPLQAALTASLTEQESWSDGLRKLYEVLAVDFVYGDPYNLVVFADNHDMSRVFSQLNEDKALWDMAMTFILTSRGIPQVFYGTEILMANPGTDDHGIIRSDFPGGWKGDEVNAFSGHGLTSDQRWAQSRIKSLLTFRGQHPAITQGKMVHYGPQDGVYVYFRLPENEDEKGVMVVLNKNQTARDIGLERFSAVLDDYSAATRLKDGKSTSLSSTLAIEGRSASVFELSRADNK